MSSNVTIASIVRATDELLSKWNASLIVDYVNTKVNPADVPSRWTIDDLKNINNKTKIADIW